MAEVLRRLKGQDLAEHQVVPMLLWPLDALPSDQDSPFVLQPFRGDENGNLLVGLGGAMGPIMLADDADTVAETAALERVPTVARLYGYDQAASAFDRIRTDDDADETSAPDSFPALRVMGRNRLFSDALDTWSREHAQDGIAVAPSASRTVTTTFGTFVNVNHRALHLAVNVTVIGADTLTIDIEGRQLFPPFDFYPLLTSLAISAIGTTILKVGIGFSPIANLTANDMIPAVWQVVATHSGVDPITYSMNANLSV